MCTNNLTISYYQNYYDAHKFKQRTFQIRIHCAKGIKIISRSQQQKKVYLHVTGWESEIKNRVLFQHFPLPTKKIKIYSYRIYVHIQSINSCFYTSQNMWTHLIEHSEIKGNIFKIPSLTLNHKNVLFCDFVRIMWSLELSVT